MPENGSLPSPLSPLSQGHTRNHRVEGIAGDQQQLVAIRATLMRFVVRLSTIHLSWLKQSLIHRCMYGYSPYKLDHPAAGSSLKDRHRRRAPQALTPYYSTECRMVNDEDQ